MKTTAWIFLTVLGMATIPAGGTPAIQEKRSFASLQESLQADRIVTYRTVGNRELSLHIFNPKDFESSGNAPAFVAIHGGGWTGGTPRRFYPYAHALVDKGYVGISVEYRLVGQKGVTVFDCVKDGRAAIRYIRAHAGELGIDPARITVSGGSAGAVLFTGRMTKAGNVCELVTEPGGDHGYLNQDMALFDAAIGKTAAFLGEHLKRK